MGWRLSDGAFDPFLGEAIVAAGYARDYASLQPAHRPATPLAAGRPHPGFRPTAAPVRHLLLDPRTGRSTSGCAAAATAIAPFGWLAEVLSKCALLLPGPRAARLAGRHNGAAVTQDWDGTVTQLG